ncbi:class III lanthipeptide [Amycolatopsis sp. NBC_00345]
MNQILALQGMSTEDTESDALGVLKTSTLSVNCGTRTIFAPAN